MFFKKEKKITYGVSQITFKTVNFILLSKGGKGQKKTSNVIFERLPMRALIVAVAKPIVGGTPTV